MVTNAERVKSLYEAFGRGDVPAVLGAFDPQIQWQEAGERPVRTRLAVSRRHGGRVSAVHRHEAVGGRLRLLNRGSGPHGGRASETIMKTLQFSTDIRASRETVWETMLADDSYRLWTPEFEEYMTKVWPTALARLKQLCEERTA